MIYIYQYRPYCPAPRKWKKPGKSIRKLQVVYMLQSYVSAFFSLMLLQYTSTAHDALPRPADRALSSTQNARFVMILLTLVTAE